MDRDLTRPGLSLCVGMRRPRLNCIPRDSQVKPAEGAEGVELIDNQCVFAIV